MKIVSVTRLYFTCNLTSFKRRLTKCNSSDSRISLRSFNRIPRSMVSNARDISNISRYSGKSWAHIAFSANILNGKTTSVVPRPGLYAAWDIDMTFLKRSNVLPTTIIARIFLRTDNKMTGIRFFAGPFGLFGFGYGIMCPNLISSGYLPVSATWLRISAIYWWITSGLYSINFVCTLSHPGLLLSFTFIMADFTSAMSIDVFNFCGGLISGMSVTESCLKIFSK